MKKQRYRIPRRAAPPCAPLGSPPRHPASPPPAAAAPPTRITEAALGLRDQEQQLFAGAFTTAYAHRVARRCKSLFKEATNNKAYSRSYRLEQLTELAATLSESGPEVKAAEEEKKHEEQQTLMLQFKKQKHELMRAAMASDETQYIKHPITGDMVEIVPGVYASLIDDEEVWRAMRVREWREARRDGDPQRLDKRWAAPQP